MCESFLVEFNLARPGRRKLQSLQRGRAFSLFRTIPPPSTQSPNTGAMLRVGQKRSMVNAALAAESGCAADSNRNQRLAVTRERTLNEFQGQTTTPKGWPLLRGASRHYKSFVVTLGKANCR